MGAERLVGSDIQRPLSCANRTLGGLTSLHPPPSPSSPPFPCQPAPLFLFSLFPPSQTVLLYGPPGCGKSHLAHAIAAAAGANFLDISPKNTDGKFTKQAGMMMHKVFKVARVMGPSVVYIDECEKVFISDKKKCGAGLEPYNRIRKDLGKEVDVRSNTGKSPFRTAALQQYNFLPTSFSAAAVAKCSCATLGPSFSVSFTYNPTALSPHPPIPPSQALEPTDLVILIGATNDPSACAKKDEAPFVKFWHRTIHLPLPYYGDRLVLWPALAARFGGAFGPSVSISTLSHISELQSTANIAMILRRIFTPRRIDVLDKRPVTMNEVRIRIRIRMRPE